MGHSYHSELYITVADLDHMDHSADARLKALKSELVRDYELDQRWEIEEWSTKHHPEHMKVLFTSIKRTPIRLCQEISQEHPELTLDFNYSNMHELGVRGMGFFHQGKGRICQNYNTYEADARGMWRVYPPEPPSDDKAVRADANPKRAHPTMPPNLSALMRDEENNREIEDEPMPTPVTRKASTGNQIRDNVRQQTAVQEEIEKMGELDSKLSQVFQWRKQWEETVMAALDSDADMEFVTKAFERMKKLFKESRIGSEIKARIATGEIPVASQNVDK